MGSVTTLGAGNRLGSRVARVDWMCAFNSSRASRVGSNWIPRERYVGTTSTRPGIPDYGGSLSAADVVTALYFYKMRYDPADPTWPERDRFLMSKGHAVPAQYAALAMLGVFPVEELPTPEAARQPAPGSPGHALHAGS